MSNDPLIGKQLGGSRIEKVLGRGGMAKVYYGHDINLRRPVAIKVIDASYRDDPSYAKRFVSEARAVAVWRHENIIQVYSAGKEGDIYYFIMEYIEGMDLSDLLTHYLSDGEIISHEDMLKIGRAIANALDYAHEKGVVHRDVKPANVMISKDDRIVLMDFGLALDVEVGSMGEIFGTPHYIAPEQARRSSDAVAQSDLYSLGIMLYEMLTGVVPFDDPSAASVALMHLSEAPPLPRHHNPKLNEAVEKVLLKSLSKDIDERYQTGAELMDALEKALKGEQLEAEPTKRRKLPPLPPGVTPPPVRTLSHVSVADKVAVTKVAAPAPQTKVPIKIPKKKPLPTSPRITRNLNLEDMSSDTLMKMILATLIVLVLAVIFVIVLVISSNNTSKLDDLPTSVIILDTDTPIPTDTLAPTATPVPTDTPVPTTMIAPSPTNTVIVPTNTSVPPTEIPTHTPVATTMVPSYLTNTVVVSTNTSIPPTIIPTHTLVATTMIVPSPTNTITPYVAPPTDAPAPTDTPAPTVISSPVPLMTGHSFQLIYNDSGFYMHNSGTDAIRDIRDISFGALTVDGLPTGYVMDGGRWSAGYFAIETNKCDGVEILDVSWTKPGQCGGYNALVNEAGDDSTIFWVARDGMTHFRVLWDGVEVARCEIAAGTCSGFVPSRER